MIGPQQLDGICDAILASTQQIAAQCRQEVTLTPALMDKFALRQRFFEALARIEPSQHKDRLVALADEIQDLDAEILTWAREQQKGLARTLSGAKRQKFTNSPTVQPQILLQSA